MKKLGPQHNIPADEWYKGSGLYIVSSFLKPAAYTGTAAPSKKLESLNGIFVTDEQIAKILSVVEMFNRNKIKTLDDAFDKLQRESRIKDQRTFVFTIHFRPSIMIYVHEVSKM